MTNRKILLLGVPRLERDRALIPVERRKAVALLAYLVVTRQTIARETLAGMFWPEANSARALAYLRTTLWTLNTALGDDWVDTEGTLVRFNAESGIFDDVSIFKGLIAQNDPARLTEAAALWRADFMSGFHLPDAPAFEEWQFFQAEELRRHFTAVLQRLIEYHSTRGETEPAIGYARRWTSLDPTHEPAHRTLMSLYNQSGQRAAALRQYQEITRILNDELGLSPEPETVELFASIRDQRAPRKAADTSGETENASAMNMNMNMEMMPFADTPARRLPAATTPFLGRTQELTEVSGLLADPNCRLLTVIGPGGIGKTRFAVRAAQLVAEADFPDGVFFAALAPVRAPEFLAQTLTYAVEYCDTTGRESKADLLKHLRDKRLLLVIDNFEHLIASADLLAEILTAAPGVKLLVTSRERLNLHEEWLFELRGLEYPASRDDDGFEKFSAVELFVQSARRARPTFSLTADDAEAILQICRLVDGMPLGIELAATWAQMLTTPEIAREIQNSLDFLSTNTRNIPERHRNLRAVFEYSWTTLDADEQGCLARLSVFRGGFTLESARQVAGATLHLMLALVGKSLVRREDNGRYTMHELLRQFAESKLSPDERRRVSERHSDYFADFLASLLPALKSAAQPEALNEIQSVFDDVSGAWGHAIQTQRWPVVARLLEPSFHYTLVRRRVRESGEVLAYAAQNLEKMAASPEERLLLVRLKTMLAFNKGVIGTREEVYQLTQQALELLREFPNHPEATLLNIMLGMMVNYPMRDFAHAEMLLNAALESAESQSDTWLMAFARLQLGWYCQNQVRYAEARAQYEKALSLFRQIGQPWGIGMTYSALAENYLTLGQMIKAREYLEASLPLAEVLDDRMRIASITGQLKQYGDRSYEIRDDLWETMLVASREMGDKPGFAWSLYHGAWMRIHADRLDEAQVMLDEAMPVFMEMDDIEGITWAHVYFGIIAFKRGDFNTARTRADTVFELLREIDFPWSRAGALYLMGDIALASHQFEESRRYYAESVRITWRVQAIVQVIRHVLGLLEALLCLEECSPLRTYTIAAYFRGHQAAAVDAYKRADAITAKLDSRLTSQEKDEARKLSADLTLEGIVGELLKEPLPERTL